MDTMVTWTLLDEVETCSKVAFVVCIAVNHPTRYVYIHIQNGRSYGASLLTSVDNPVSRGTVHFGVCQVCHVAVQTTAHFSAHGKRTQDLTKPPLEGY